MERPCPGDRVEFTCTISSDRHLWEVPNITQGLLRNSTPISVPPFEFAVVERMPDSITSIAVVIITTPLTEVLNGTLILCRDGIGTEPEQNTAINLRGEHADVESVVYKAVIHTYMYNYTSNGISIEFGSKVIISTL